MGSPIRKLPLYGGNLALDFTNTVDLHASDHPRELLADYGAVVRWSQHVGTVNRQQANALLQLAAADPEDGARTHRRVVGAREALYRVFSAVAGGEKPPAADLQLVNDELRATYAHARVQAVEGGFRLGLDLDEIRLDMVLWPVLQAAAELLTRGDLDRIKQCADESGCGWLFYDTTKNRSRRWCNMAVCGNRNKARRHYRKLKRQRATVRQTPAAKPGANTPPGTPRPDPGPA